MKTRTFSLLLLLAACDGSGDQTIEFTLKSPLAAGSEAHFCQFVRMPDSADGEVLVTSQSHRANAGHHWSVIRTNVEDVPDGFALDTPVDCFTSGISAYAGSALFIEQEGTIGPRFPEGTALGFRAGEILMLQLHTLNTTSQKIESELTVSFETTTSRDMTRVGLIQFYDPFIFVPPMGAATAQMRCPIPQEITLLNATTHFHERGVRQQVFVDLPGQPGVSPLVESSDWQHPNSWNGSMVLPAGSTVRSICEYRNNDPRAYIQGQEKEDNEMCVVLGFYHPQLDAPFEGCFAGFDYGTGTKTCMETTECTRACPPNEAPSPNGTLAIDVGPCFQQCMVEACASASTRFLQVSDCLRDNCGADCAGGGPECGACLADRCGAELSACQTDTCS